MGRHLRGRALSARSAARKREYREQGFVADYTYLRGGGLMSVYFPVIALGGDVRTDKGGMVCRVFFPPRGVGGMVGYGCQECCMAIGRPAYLCRRGDIVGDRTGICGAR